MIGEIRDRESAQVALEAAMTGHLVLSTIHTQSSLDVIPRLRDLGIEKSLVASGLVGAVTQKLMRKICHHCVESKIMEKEDKSFLSQYVSESELPLSLNYGKGCNHCSYSGYLGRLPVFEGWSSSKNLQDLILEDAHLTAIKSELEENADFHDLLKNALKIVILGQTTLEEVKRVLGFL
jgi:type II secretory ATPase GspE/PulE/Tfp pilus assembly ATPase PilB-like protein